MYNIRHPICPKCHGHTRYVSKRVVFPGERLTLERLFHCPKCKLYAHADRDGKAIEGVGSKRLHNLRQKTKDRLKESGMERGYCMAEMDLKPWEMDIAFWTQKQCVRALNTVLNDEPEKEPTVKELLS